MEDLYQNSILSGSFTHLYLNFLVSLSLPLPPLLEFLHSEVGLYNYWTLKKRLTWYILYTVIFHCSENVGELINNSAILEHNTASKNTCATFRNMVCTAFKHSTYIKNTSSALLNYICPKEKFGCHTAASTHSIRDKTRQTLYQALEKVSNGQKYLGWNQ